MVDNHNYIQSPLAILVSGYISSLGILAKSWMTDFLLSKIAQKNLYISQKILASLAILAKIFQILAFLAPKWLDLDLKTCFLAKLF